MNDARRKSAEHLAEQAYVQISEANDKYEFTDFPLDELRLFFVDDMLMLPNEY